VIRAIENLMASRRRIRCALTAVIGLGAFMSQTVRAQSSAADSVAHVNAVLAPGDLIRLKIWREPDLSGDFPVDEMGNAVFPKVGTLPVGSLTTDSLKALLLARYAVYLQDPAVDVTFLRRVNVLGEVRTPGLYHVDPTMTVADLLAMAGGVSSDGNPNKIELIRQGKPLPVKLTQQSSIAGSPLRSGDQLRVSRRSWLSRNTALIGAGITATAVIFAAVLRP
jgi:polysaccharide biosynthesis/export protein